MWSLNHTFKKEQALKTGIVVSHWRKSAVGKSRTKLLIQSDSWTLKLLAAKCRQRAISGNWARISLAIMVFIPKLIFKFQKNGLAFLAGCSRKARLNNAHLIHMQVYIHAHAHAHAHTCAYVYARIRAHTHTRIYARDKEGTCSTWNMSLFFKPLFRLELASWQCALQVTPGFLRRYPSRALQFHPLGQRRRRCPCQWPAPGRCHCQWSSPILG